MSELALKLIEENRKTRSPSLDLGMCGLAELPQELFELSWLEELNLRDCWFDDEKAQWVQSPNSFVPNRLSVLPDLRSLKKLKILRLGGGDSMELGLDILFWLLDDLTALTGLDQLQELHVAFCRITNIDPLTALTGLQQLDVSSNKLSDLSPLMALTGLQRLDVSANQISDLSPLTVLTGLQQLDVSSNKLSDLSPLTALTGLQRLNVGYNEISDLSPLTALTGLKWLDVRDNEISDLSPLTALTGLQRLDVNAIQISDLSPLTALTGLQQLDVGYNEISDLSPLRALTGLQRLDVSEADVSDLSPLAALIGLRQLDVSGNEAYLSDLSPLTALTRLQQLNVGSNQISDLSPLTALTGLQQLDVSFNQISDLSPLTVLTGLQQLDVRSNQISDLSLLTVLTGLQQLDASAIQTSDLSPLTALTGLKRLNVRDNQISDLSPLMALIGLQQLEMDHNKISDLSSLTALTGLKQLDVRNNRISDLSPLTVLTGLQQLDVRHNEISDLSPLTALTGLQRLNVEHNRISDLSLLANLIRTNNLEVSLEDRSRGGLIVGGNPLEKPPPTIVEEGREAVLAYFAEITETKEKLADFVNQEAMLIVLGNSTAGKSTLIKYLRSSPAVRRGLKNDRTIFSTQGMQRVTWQPKFKLRRSGRTLDQLRINILDFGGQEYYHDCHHLFFTDRTAYLVLWEKNTNIHDTVKTRLRLTADEAGDEHEVSLEHHPLEYWLEAIAFFVQRKRMPDWNMRRMSVSITEGSDPVEVDWESLCTGPIQDDSGAKAAKLRSARRQAKTPTQEERIAVNKPERAFASLDDLSHSLRQLLLQSPEFASLTSDEQDAKLDEYMQQLKSDLYSRIGAVTVQNKFDLDERVHLNAEALQRKFPFFIDNISVSVLVGTRMDYLENILLAELFEQLDLVGEIYPGTYPKVIEKIAKRNAFQLKLDDIRELYRGVLDEYSLRYEDDRFDNFLTYAQSIGRILFFPEWEEIKDIVFSQPHQMLQRFYAILNDKLEHPRGDCAVGEFDRDYALNAIRQSFYKGKARRQKQSAAEQEADAILKLMLRFHVVFQPDPTEACYIAPQYLPAQPHRTISFVRDTFSKPLYRYVYQGFIHTSIILHFYSEYGQHAEKEYPEARSASDYLFWKDGIFIRKGADLVLVEFDRKRYRVNIYPKSELKRNPLIDEIVTTLDRISSGRSFQKQVSADGEHFIPLDILEARAERGIPWLEFEGKIHRLGEFREFVQQQYPMKKIFISYSSADLAYVEELKAHLSVLQRNNLVDTWYDRKIVPGQEWDKKIKDELHSADIILLLVSSDFLHSDYIWDIEVRAAVEMHKQGEAKVIPVILRSCLWEGRYSPFSTLQSPRKGAPLDLADNKDQAWKEIIQGVVNVIDGKDVDAQAEPTS